MTNRRLLSKGLGSGFLPYNCKELFTNTFYILEMKYLYTFCTLIFSFFLLSFSNLEAQSGTWEFIHNGNNCAAHGRSGSCMQGRHEASYVQVGDRFYLLGGRENNSNVNIYDPIREIWTVGANAPFPIHHFQAVEYNGLILIMGAMTGNFPRETPIPNIMIYDPKTDRWSTGPSIPSNRRRGSAGVVVYNDKIYMVSGIIDGHQSGWVPWLDEYDPQAGTWRTLRNAPHSRDHFHAALYGDRIVVGGGRRSGQDGTFNATEGAIDIYDISSGTWITHNRDIPTHRAAPAVGVIGDEVIFMGGERNSGSANDETEALNMRTGAWRTLRPMNTGRHGTQAIVNNDNIWVASGSPNRGGGRVQSQERFFLDSRRAPSVRNINRSTVTAPASVSIANRETERVWIDNSSGDQAVLVEDIDLLDGGYTINLSRSVPFFLKPGTRFAIDVTRTNGNNARLRVRHSGQNSENIINISEGIQGTGINVAFTTPSNNATFQEGASIGAVINASDSNGSISMVQMFLNNQQLRQERGAPYEWGSSNSNSSDPALENLSAGNYTLRAVATDNNGNTEETSISFTVERAVVNNSTFFIPDPNKTYFIDNVAHNTRLRADGVSNDPFIGDSGNTGDHTRWRFIARGNGSWHIQRSAGGTRPRLRSDNTSLADMQETAQVGVWTYFDMPESSTPGAYHIVLPDGPAAFKRLQFTPDGEIKMVSDDWTGTWTQFRITEADAGCNSFSDVNFENGLSIWNDGGGDCFLLNDNDFSNSGNWSVRLRDNSGAASSLISDRLDFSSVAEVNVSFSFLPESFETGEDFFLEASTNGGSSFSTIERWIVGTDFSNDSRENASVTIGSSNLSNNTVLRIRCDASGNADLLYIDDLEIETCGSRVVGQTTDLAIAAPQEDNDSVIESKKVVSTISEIQLNSRDRSEDGFSGPITVSPNPSASVIRIDFSSYMGNEISYNVHSINGDILMQGKYDADHESIETLSLDQVPSGTYVLRLQTDMGNVIAQKIVVLRQ